MQYPRGLCLLAHILPMNIVHSSQLMVLSAVIKFYLVSEFVKAIYQRTMRGCETITQDFPADDLLRTDRCAFMIFVNGSNGCSSIIS